MIIPEDWDKPDKDNARLCRKFEYRMFDKGEISLPYRLFRAETSEPVPLVIFLHGADAVGNDNEQQLSIHDIGTMFARDSWQKRHPCHIAAPQYNRGMHWSNDSMGDVIVGLVQELSHELTFDDKRIYIYGYSAGGVGTLKYIKEYPGFFAGAISVCGATSVDNLEALKSTPLWMIHAADDRIVKASYREPGSKILYHYGSRDIYELIGDTSDSMNYSELPEGYMTEKYGVNPHCSWVCVSNKNKQEYGEWFFSQVAEQ